MRNLKNSLYHRDTLLHGFRAFTHELVEDSIETIRVSHDFIIDLHDSGRNMHDLVEASADFIPFMHDFAKDTIHIHDDTHKLVDVMFNLDKAAIRFADVLRNCEPKSG